MKPEEIKLILENLDTDDDNLWTADGAPLLTNFGKGVSRAEVLAVAPLFTRLNPSFEMPPPLERPSEDEVTRESGPKVPEAVPQHILDIQDNLNYLARQAELRKERAQRTRQVRQVLAANPGATGRSPIDQKIAANNRAARRGSRV